MSNTLDLEQLLTDQEGLRKQQEAYNLQLKKKILTARRTILSYITQKHHITLNQQRIRELSRTFVSQNYPIPKDLGQLPLQIGTSKQDAMHHTHWIQACLLLHYLNKTPRKLLQNEDLTLQPEQVVNICTVNEDTTSRLEEQWRVYYNLRHLITGKDEDTIYTQVQKQKKVTNEMLYNKLLTLEKQMKQQTEVLKTLKTLKTLVQEKRS